PNPTLIATNPDDGSIVRAKYQLGKEKLLINIGRIAAEKNLTLLLKTFRYLIDRAEPDTLKLMIVGEGPELENLIQQAKELGLSDQVIFTGLIAPAEVPLYLAAADLFVMTSLSEVKPLSQLEALAAGVPIVSVKAPGANDTIIHDHNGLLVEDRVETIGDTVLSLLKDTSRHTRYQAAARQTAERYSHSKIASEYLELFQTTIARHQQLNK
ncbi:MAG TPA: glycosyltransferase, partial [Bacillota bacterium]|nr:glycosyltransferase [Bacillota bacterium]